MTTDLAEGDLGPLGALLGSGGQAKVFELPALSLPDVAGPLVYKQYKPGRAPAHGMGKIIALRARLQTDPGKLARLDDATAWPVRQVVNDDGAPLGLVLRRIPDSFMQDIRLPSGTVKTIPREVQFLFIPPDRALRGGTPTPTPTERLTICRDFAATLTFLHDELNVAFGDINARNAVFRIDEEPTVMFVDCDAVRVIGDMAVAPQLNAPDWDPPEGSDVLSRSTDLYKLGLFVLRCLTPDKNSSINRDPNQARGVLDAHGLTLLTDAVRGAPADRPSAEAWHRYLRHALGEAFAPPRLEKVELNRTIVAAGEPITVTWSALEADTVTASGVGVPETVVRGVAGAGTLVLHPTRTGRLTITARNNLGEDSRETEAVGVFDLPSFQDLPVPMPTMALPRPTPMELPSVARLFPPLPPAGTMPMPALVHAWATPDTTARPDPVRLTDSPPVFGFGPSAVPFDPASAFVPPVAPAAPTASAASAGSAGSAASADSAGSAASAGSAGSAASADSAGSAAPAGSAGSAASADPAGSAAPAGPAASARSAASAGPAGSGAPVGPAGSAALADPAALAGPAASVGSAGSGAPAELARPVPPAAAAGSAGSAVPAAAAASPPGAQDDDEESKP